MLLKKILSSYVITFLIIASFSLIVLGANETVRGAKKLFTTPANENSVVSTDSSTSDSSDDSEDTDTVKVTPAASNANENSVVSTDSSTSDSSDDSEDTDTVKVTPAASNANENSVVSTDSTNPANENSVVSTDSIITDENSNEDDEDDNFWNWIADYDKEDKDLNLHKYNYTENNESNNIIGHGFIFKLRNKMQNNKHLFIADYLFLKFEKYFQ